YPVLRWCSQSVSQPVVQYSHVPQANPSHGKATRSPTATSVTPAPRLSTIPTPSWPGMNGSFGLTGQSPCAAWMSVWHRPDVSIRTTTSPDPATGFGTSSMTSGSLNSWTTAAFMVISPFWKVQCWLEEPDWAGAVADQQVLGLLVVVEHHLVRLAADARLLVAAERGVGRVRLGVVNPDPTGLDPASDAVRGVGVARPNPGAQAEHRVVGDLQGLVEVLERGDGHDGAEDLLLENPHPVVALEDGRLDVVAVFQAAEDPAVATGEHPRPFGGADVDVAEDFLQLPLACLRADHRRRVERVTGHNGLHSLQRPRHELVVDGAVDQRSGRARAHLALIQREHHEAFDRLV